MVPVVRDDEELLLFCPCLKAEPQQKNDKAKTHPSDGLRRGTDSNCDNSGRKGLMTLLKSYPSNYLGFN